MKFFDWKNKAQSFVLCKRNKVAEGSVTLEFKPSSTNTTAEQFASFNFKAGQFVSVNVNIKGQMQSRCYSITSPPNDTMLQVTVKKVEGGIVSSYLHDDIQVGDSVELMAPVGQFNLDIIEESEAEEVLLLGAGSGITPLYTMLRSMLDIKKKNVKITLIYAVKNIKEAIFCKELDGLNQKNDHLNVHFFVESMEGFDKTNQALLQVHQGYVNKETIKKILPNIAQNEVLMCGPTPFLETMADMLTELNVPKNLRHQEVFVSPNTAMIAPKSNTTDGKAIVNYISSYPIKSTQGMRCSSALVTPNGLSLDRLFMVTTEGGKMITARNDSRLFSVQAMPYTDGFYLSYPNKEGLWLDYNSFELDVLDTHVWYDNFTACTTNTKVDKWFSEILEQPVKLLYSGKNLNRVFEKIEPNVRFTDGYPLSIVSSGSLDELNRRCPIENDMDQFRINVIVKSDVPFVEDCWRVIKIGDIIFDVLEPIQRCVLTTIDVNTIESLGNNEPISTMQKFRANEKGGTFFGQNMVARSTGVIRSGDEVEVLEYKEKDYYPDNQAQEVAVPYKDLSMVFNGFRFDANNQLSILSQAEKVGVNITNSCRAGVCGCCKVKVTKGDVDQPMMPGITQEEIDNGIVLACTCKALTDVELEDVNR